MLIALLFGLMLLVMLMRVFLPRGTRKPAKVIKVVGLSLVERFLLQRMNLYCIGAVLLLMTLTSSISIAAEVLVLLAAQGILAIPVRCVLSSEGIGISNVVFRPWSDFTSFSVTSRRVTLTGREGTRPLNLPLLPDHQREVIPALRRHLPETKTRKEAGAEHRVTVS